MFDNNTLFLAPSHACDHESNPSIATPLYKRQDIQVRRIYCRTTQRRVAPNATQNAS